MAHAVYDWLAELSNGITESNDIKEGSVDEIFLCWTQECETYFRNMHHRRPCEPWHRTIIVRIDRLKDVDLGNQMHGHLAPGLYGRVRAIGFKLF